MVVMIGTGSCRKFCRIWGSGVQIYLPSTFRGPIVPFLKQEEDSFQKRITAYYLGDVIGVIEASL